MSSEWQAVTLADISCNVDYGYTAAANPKADGPLFLRITDIVGGSVDWQAVPRCEISGTDFVKYRLQAGDIVVARTGASSGESYRVRSPVEAVFASYLVRFRLNLEKADPRFVGYILRSPLWWDHVRNYVGGSAQPQLNARVMGEFELRLPPLHEQRRIGGVLGALDDKIEHNQMMARRLADLAALHWSRASKSSGGEGVLGDIASLRRDLVAPDGADLQTPYVGLDNMKPGVPVLSEWLAGSKAPQGQSTRFHRGDLLFGKLRPYFKKVAIAPIEGRCSTEILVVRPKKEEYWGPLVGFMMSDAFIAYCIAVSRGTKMPRAEWPDASQFPVALPDLDEARELTGVMRPLHMLASFKVVEGRRLSAVRDAILPKLASGAIRVPDAYDPDVALGTVAGV